MSDPGAMRFRCTIGNRAVQKQWPESQEFTWPGLCAMLTDHREGAKDGRCIIFASLREPERKAEFADEISAITFDSDCGHALDEILAKIHEHGYAAIIYSTHSHLTTRITVARAEFERRGLTAEQYLIQIKGFLPCVAAGARILASLSADVTIEHQPCPKYRVILRLDRPWKASDFGSQEKAIEAWRERYLAAAYHLKLTVDPACADPCRLFYLPRHATGRPYDTRIIEGRDLPLWDLPKIREEPQPTEQCEKRAMKPTNGNGGDQDVIGAFNSRHPIEEILREHGYKETTPGKWLAPTSSTKMAGVAVKDGVAFSHHGSDPLFTGGMKGDKGHDAFSAFCILDHDGDVTRAVRAAAQLLGVEYSKPGNGVYTGWGPMDYPELNNGDATNATNATMQPNAAFCNEHATNGAENAANMQQTRSAAIEQSERNLSESVRNWLETCDGPFFVHDIATELHIPIKSSSTLRSIICRLVTEGTLAKEGSKRGFYRKRMVVPTVDPFAEECGSEFDLHLPLGLNEVCKILPKNVIVIAGTKDAGKTAMALNIAKANRTKHDVHYYYSESGLAELRARLECFKDMTRQDWKNVNFHPVNEHFEDCIIQYPDDLHVIDFLEIHDEFYKVGGEIRKFFDALRNGVVIVLMQKKSGGAFGKGGEATIEKARLYVNLNRGFDSKIPYTTAEIMSAKVPRYYGQDYKGRKLNFRIDWGWKIIELSKWE